MYELLCMFCLYLCMYIHICRCCVCWSIGSCVMDLHLCSWPFHKWTLTYYDISMTMVARQPWNVLTQGSCFSFFNGDPWSSVFASPQLGLMTSPDQKKCQRAYYCAHRIFIYVLLLFTSAIQNAVCFRRDGFAATLPLSNINETVCDAELHLIVSNIVQEGLVITAYTLLLWYSIVWQPERKDLVSITLFRLLFCSV